jgi:hypothetical protein
MNRKQFAAATVLFIGVSLPVLAVDQKPANSEAHHVPRLNDMMVRTQLRHFKLWYAGTVQNWSLANYELAQIRTDIDDAKSLYPNIAGSDLTIMIPACVEVDRAVKAKDSVNFSIAFGKLTAECNSCHEAAGFGFIKIREPKLSPLETSPFSDEEFLSK